MPVSFQQASLPDTLSNTTYVANWTTEQHKSDIFSNVALLLAMCISPLFYLFICLLVTGSVVG